MYGAFQVSLTLLSPADSALTSLGPASFAAINLTVELVVLLLVSRSFAISTLASIFISCDSSKEVVFTATGIFTCCINNKSSSIVEV